MIAELIVAASLVFALGLTVAWCVSPTVRAWLERPKHTLHDALLRYDVGQAARMRAKDAQQP